MTQVNVWCRLFGHKDDVVYRPKPRKMNPNRPGRRLYQRDDIVLTCSRCERVEVRS